MKEAGVPVIGPETLSSYDVGAAHFQPLTDPARDGAELAVWQLQLPPGPAGAPHVIDREEVFLCTSGTLNLTIDGEAATLAPGDACAAKAGSRVSAGAGEHGATATVCCRLGLVATMADGSELRPPWAQRHHQQAPRSA